jgi:hypothetical protein
MVDPRNVDSSVGRVYSGRVTARPDDLDLRMPCSHCGACCTGTYLLWFTADERRQTAEIDQPTLDAVFERGTGLAAPAIVREWNAGGGWTDEVDGAATDARELVELLGRHGPALDDDGRIARLAAYVRDACAAGASLYIRDD